jgi:YfiH family protein
VADCLPIFFEDRESGAFGIVHSGWKGTGIVRTAIKTMNESFGTQASAVSVTVGPGIGPCCYDVPLERYDAFRSEFGAAAVRRDEEGKCFLDLRSANLALLCDAGITDVTVIEDCTACSPVLGSFRRQGPRAFTRMLAFIGARRFFPSFKGAQASSRK